jgi:hypothetical protein
MFSLILIVPYSVSADASSNGLGPAPASNSGTSSSADTSALQPAGTSTLQSNNGDTTGLSSGPTDGNTLQQPASATTGSLQVLLNGEADGASHSNDTSRSIWWYILWIIIALIIIAGGLVYIRRKMKIRLDSSQDVELAESLESTNTDGAVIETTNDAELHAALLNPLDEAEKPIDEATLEVVHNDKIVPPNVSDSNDKTGDTSGKALKNGKNKKHKKHHKR